LIPITPSLFPAGHLSGRQTPTTQQMNKYLTTSLVLLLAPTALAQKTVLIGPDLRNGDFNEDTDPTDQRNFDQTPVWENAAGPPALTCARTNLTNLSGSRNAQISHANNQLMAQSTGHVLAEGDSFSVSYEWRDAFNWDDAIDKVNIILFITPDDLINSPRTIIGSAASPLSTIDSTYEPVTSNDFYIADATHVGRTVFVGIDTINEDGNGFCRLDDFQLSVGTPESDPILRLESGDLAFGDLVHPSSVTSTSRVLSFSNLGAANNLGIISVSLSPESDSVFSITEAPANGSSIPPGGTFEIEVTATGGSQFNDYTGELIIGTIPPEQGLTIPISATISNGAEQFEMGSTLLVDYDDGLDNGIHESSIRNGGFEDGMAGQTINETPDWVNSFSPEGDTAVGTFDTAPATGLLHGQTSGWQLINDGEERAQPGIEIPATDWTLAAGDTLDIEFAIKGGTNWTNENFEVIVEVLDEFGTLVNDGLNGQNNASRWLSLPITFLNGGFDYETVSITTPEIQRNSPWIGNHFRLRIATSGPRTSFLHIDNVSVTANFKTLLEPSGALEITAIDYNAGTGETTLRFLDSGAPGFVIESSPDLDFDEGATTIPLDGTEDRLTYPGEIVFSFTDPSATGLRHFWRVKAQ